MPTDKYAPRSPEDVARLVLENPLAWIVSGSPGPARSTLLPLRPRFGDDGRITHLLGHYSRGNPQVPELKRQPEATILFLGPQGYLSPSWYADRTQAPTWNYASVEFRVEIEFRDDPESLEYVLRDLGDAMEAGRPNPWRIEDMGDRYHGLAQRIIAFHAAVREERPKFKLGQDERDDVYADIRRALSASDRDGELLAWMERFNPGRPPAD